MRGINAAVGKGGVMKRINEFKKDFRYSNKHDKFWWKIYSEMFDMNYMFRSPKDLDMKGVDRVIVLSSGDLITIDAIKNTIDFAVTDEELAQRKADWEQPDLKHKKGVLYKYAKTVSCASEGCVTDEF